MLLITAYLKIIRRNIEIVSELKNLTAVKSGISNLEKATNEQNRKLSQLTESIKELAQVKTSGGYISNLCSKMD